MTPLWDRARERFFQTDLKIWNDRAASDPDRGIDRGDPPRRTDRHETASGLEGPWREISEGTAKGE